jgi:hypothetical protein
MCRAPHCKQCSFYEPTPKSAAKGMVSTMSKAQKRGNREAKKPKAVKKVEQPAVSSPIKTAVPLSDQPKKKR